MASRDPAGVKVMVRRAVEEHDGRAMFLLVTWWWSRLDAVMNADLSAIFADLGHCVEIDDPLQVDNALRAILTVGAAESVATEKDEAELAAIAALGGWCDRIIDRRNSSTCQSITWSLQSVIDAFTQWRRETPDPSAEQVDDWRRQLVLTDELIVRAIEDSAPELSDPESRLWALLGRWKLMCSQIADLVEPAR